MRTRDPLSRRTLLRGAGVALGLPWLEAMGMPASKDGGPVAPKRLCAMYMPNGVREDVWTPEGTGRDFKLSPTLAPLEDLKNEILVLTNLWNEGSKGGDGHYVKNAGWLTCRTITKTLGVDLNANGVSMDQLAARQAGRYTPLPSLELGIAPVTTGVDRNVGYTRVYGSHIAWSSPTTPLAREINPRLVYERLFRASGPQGDQTKRDAALLDKVLGEAKQLREELGQSDRLRLDEYMSTVRGLEERLERSTAPERAAWKPRVPFDPAAKPEGIPKEFPDHVRLMMDMIALAFETDTTRVATFMFGNEVTNQNFSFVPGVNEGHHQISHHEKDPDKLRQYHLINRWHIEQYAYLLRKLRGMREGEGTVLDHSMIMVGSGIRDGNKHDPHNLPVVVGGRAGGRLATGQHLSYGPDTPLASLYLAMLDAFDVPMERFADSNGRLAGVLNS